MKALNLYQISPSVLRKIWIIFLFSALGFLLYSNTFDSPFVFDDISRILENPDLRLTQMSVKNIIKAGFGKKAAKSRPVGNISLALNYYFNQYSPAGYHLINIIIHILTGIILFYFLKATLSLPSIESKNGRSSAMAFFAALIWLVHPIQTQSVTYIVQRLNSLAALFFVLAFYLYLSGRLAKQPGRKWCLLGGAALSWVLALGCKQNAATLPLFIFIYEWYFFQDFRTTWFKSNLKYLVVAFVLFGVIGFLYLGMEPWEKIKRLNDFSHGEFTLAERILTQPRVIVYYLSLIFFPHPSRLNLDYDFPLSHSLFNPVTTFFSLILIISLIALAFYLAKKERLISFCILWFFGNLVIESSIIPLAIIFEHRNYLPSMLVCLIPVVLAYRYIKPDWIKIGLLSAVVLGLCVWTYQRNRVWENEITLWRDVVKKSPNKARPHFNLGAAFSEKKWDEQAIPQYQRALEINPGLAEPHINLGETFQRQGKIEKAAEHYRAALKIDPDLPEVYNNMGAILAKQGKTEEAIQFYQKALKIRPHFALAHFGLAKELAEKGKIEQGIRHYYQALKYKPEYAEAHNNLGAIFLNSGETEKAIKHYLAALQLDPSLVEAYSNLGVALMHEGKIEAAISQFQKALKLNPTFTTADNNLKRALAIQEEFKKEIARLQQLLKDDPENVGLHFQLGNLYFRKGDQIQAMQQYNKAIQLDPKFVPALNNMALLTAANEEYYKALTIFFDVLKYTPDDAETHYNIACMYARLKRVDESIEWLQKAIDRGYANWENIKKDSDLDNIRESSAYKKLIQGH
jgi:tetratricopeptide (TPR) repeat protein